MTEKPAPTRAAAAEYIALEASKLARIANANEFSMLAYLLDMAVLEAWRENTEPDGESDAVPALSLQSVE